QQRSVRRSAGGAERGGDGRALSRRAHHGRHADPATKLKHGTAQRSVHHAMNSSRSIEPSPSPSMESKPTRASSYQPNASSAFSIATNSSNSILPSPFASL